MAFEKTYFILFALSVELQGRVTSHKPKTMNRLLDTLFSRISGIKQPAFHFTNFSWFSMLTRYSLVLALFVISWQTSFSQIAVYGLNPVVPYVKGVYTPTSVAVGAASTNLVIGEAHVDDCPSTFLKSQGYNRNTLEEAVIFGDYYQFTISANAGSDLDVTTINVNNLLKRQQGPPNIAVSYSIDGGAYNNVIGSVTATTNGDNEMCLTTTPSNSVVFAINKLAQNNIAVQLVFWGGGGSGKVQQVRFQNIIVNGTVLPEAPLPVEWKSFDARWNGNAVQLDWATASERDNSHFEVEHSLDGQTFRSISLIPAKGNTNETSRYSFLHESPEDGQNYYRIQQADFNGTFTYSSIVAVNVVKDPEPLLFANLVSNELRLIFPEITEDRYSVTAFNAFGSLAKSFDVEPGLTEATLPVSELASGNYFLRVQGERSVTVYKWVKR
jgi:hypothetical protein